MELAAEQCQGEGERQQLRETMVVGADVEVLRIGVAKVTAVLWRGREALISLRLRHRVRVFGMARAYVVQPQTPETLRTCGEIVRVPLVVVATVTRVRGGVVLALLGSVTACEHVTAVGGR